MKKIVYIFSLAVAIGFASCQKSEVQTQEESSEVVFTSGISTRVTGTAWDEGDQIGVFMYNNGATAVSG
ncbi:MAG: fimbrillin family protein, partial [Rikenellaceae bacterium]